jgi:glycosyltransferase involved in cell wall biosynthesis
VDNYPIAILMTTFNGERFIAQQLESLAAQELPPAELVICDDGSTDQTLEIVNHFARTASFPVQVHRNPQRLGYVDNFLQGIGKCSAPYVAFCDQDDVWDPRKIRIVTECVRRTGADLVMHSGAVVDDALNPRGIQFPTFAQDSDDAAPVLDPFLAPPGFAQVFNRRVACLMPVDSRPGPLTGDLDRPMTHDRWTYLVLRSIGRVAVIAESLVRYRQHASNTVGVNAASTRDKVKYTFAADAGTYRFQADLCEKYASYLQHPAQPLAEDRAKRCRRAIAWFRSRAFILQRRAEVYDARSFVRRVVSFSRLCFKGGYGRRAAGGLGLKSFAKDLSIGLTRGPVRQQA